MTFCGAARLIDLDYIAPSQACVKPQLLLPAPAPGGPAVALFGDVGGGVAALAVWRR